MDRPLYEKLKEDVSSLKRFTDPNFYPAWMRDLENLQAETPKMREVIDGILQNLQAAGEMDTPRVAITEQNQSLIQEAAKAFETGARCLGSISSEGLFIQDGLHETAIKAENDFRIAESIKARRSRCVVITSGEAAPLRPLLPRRRERESLSGGDLRYKSRRPE